ncbi:MAG: alpha-mannosidase, partial [Lentisphaeria bacterium]|nr:alpha-mannosidase [Lentisphaeria bacterium]
PNAFRPLVILDDEDPWGMRVESYRDVAGAFELMAPDRGARFSGVTSTPLPSVRVIEDGAVRVVIEAVFEYEDSQICQSYILPRSGSAFEVETRVFWSEKNRMLKLSVPLAFEGRFLGQVAYGREELPDKGREMVAQKWVAVAENDGHAITCLNAGSYASDYCDGELRLTLLRSPAYSGHPIKDRPVVPQDRFLPRIDQGERLFRFRFQGGPADSRLSAVDREALAFNEHPFALSFFPSGAGVPAQPGVLCDNPSVLVTACKQAEDGDGWIVRLFEPEGLEKTATISLPALGFETVVTLAPFEIRSLLISPDGTSVATVNLVEEE